MNENTQFLEAVKSGDTDQVRTLLKTKPQLARLQGKDNTSALMSAVYAGHEQVVALILMHVSKLTAHEAAACGQLNALQRAIERDPSVLNALSPDGWTPLHLACFFGHRDLVAYLLKVGAELNVAATNALRVTPLHSALARGEDAIALLLIEAGADPNTQQQSGWTPLHYAAVTGQTDVVKALLKRGADTSLHNDAGDTACDLAMQKGNEPLRRLLRPAT